MVSPSSSPSSACWSDLPLDLLVSISNLLHFQRSDLLSFRSVCSHWRSAVPAPDPPPCYFIRPDSSDDGIISLDVRSNSRRFISVPFPTTRKIDFFCTSNGWLVFFVSYKSVFLFDPVTGRKHLLPLPTNVFKSAGRCAQVNLGKVVVSSSRDNELVVAVLISKHPVYITGQKLAFCRPERDKRWKILRENSYGLRDAIVSSCGRRFYAIGERWELYMVEVGPPMRSKKFNLRLPMFGNLYDPQTLTPVSFHMRETAGGFLKVYGFNPYYPSGEKWTSLKVLVEAAELHANGRDSNVLCEAKPRSHIPFEHKYCFTPMLSNAAQVKRSHIRYIWGKDEPDWVLD